MEKRAIIAMWGLVLLALVLSVFFYPQMPARVASHWNARGQVDGTMGPFWGVFMVPLMMAGMALLFMVLPLIDPKKANVAQFRDVYGLFVVVITLFMLLVHLQVLLWNVGLRISPNATMPVGIGLLFLVLGTFLGKTKPNWFMGIRTPWTLSSDVVWDKTHRLGGRLFQVSGMIALLGVFFPSYAFVFIMVPILLTSLVTVVYSYVEYRRLGT